MRDYCMGWGETGMEEWVGEHMGTHAEPSQYNPTISITTNGHHRGTNTCKQKAHYFYDNRKEKISWKSDQRNLVIGYATETAGSNITAFY